MSRITDTIMIRPAPEIIKSTDCPINFPSTYGSTAMSARNHPPKKFKWFDTF